MEVFVANFGRGNALWEYCKRTAVISTYADKDVHELWRARDREAFIELCMRSKTTAAGKRVTRGVASLWFNAGDTFANTAGDLWLHREGDDLWWTTSRSEPLSESVEAVPMRGVDGEVYVLRKPAAPWQNRDQRGRRLQWSGVHAKARDFLVTVSTVRPLRGSNADYARALVGGESLDPWHGQNAWRAKEEKSGRSAVTRASPIELSARRMAQQAFGTATNSNGQEETRIVKNKDVLGFNDEHALAQHIRELFEEQEGLCAISGIELQHYGEHEDLELVCSLDRVDSNGHYERGNLQVVCRFINRWKSDSSDEDFRRLFRLVQTSGA